MRTTAATRVTRSTGRTRSGRALTAAVAAGTLASVLSTSGSATAAEPATARTSTPASTTQATTRPARLTAGEQKIRLKRWSSVQQLRQGRRQGVRINTRGTLRIRQPIGTTKVQGHRYAYGRWTSPWTKPGFGADEVIASWNATTAKHTWVKVQLRGRTAGGQRGSWDSLARWANRDERIKRTSRGPQHDDYSSVNVDTVTLDGRHRYTRWQIRVTLYRPKGKRRTPRVQSLGAVASALPSRTPKTSTTTVKRRVELDVPRYSQMIHEGDYPQWDGGGEAWCSPTSTTMVLHFFGSGPTPKQYAWVKRPHKNRYVDHAARYTYDYRYRGTGNWPFNTAYAGTFGLDAFVTRLSSLRDAERLVKAGIPVVVSISFGPGGLDGSPLTSTPGHLLTIVGFAKRGKPIVNDPAAANNAHVRHVYKRGQFEHAWLKGSGGMAYVIHPRGRALPKRSGTHRW